MGERQDLRSYSENELSLMVFNTEHLYLARRRMNFSDLLSDCFLYTDEQFDILLIDLELDENENK